MRAILSEVVLQIAVFRRGNNSEPTAEIDVLQSRIPVAPSASMNSRLVERCDEGRSRSAETDVEIDRRPATTASTPPS